MHRLILLTTLLIPSLFLNAQTVRQVPHHKQENDLAFTPDGYYFSTEEIIIGNYTFRWLAVSTIMSNATTASLRLEGKKKWVDIPSENFSLKPDSAVFYFKDKACGKVIIKGRFKGQNASVDDNEEAMKTIVFEGSITIDNATTPLKLVWWEGE